MATSGNCFSWENSKENAAPLTRGRRIEHLEQPEMSTLEKAEAIIRFERRILEEAASDTPLSAWIDYIKWHEDKFPSQVHDQFHLIERCFQTFQTDHRFFHDIRYIRVCCLYADKTQEPTQTFQELYLTGIGRTSAIFWNAWAFVAEKSGNFRLADRIYRQAVEERAEPMAYLLQRKTHFQKRMAKHFLESLNAPEDIEEDEEQQRNVFESVYGGSGLRRPVRMGSSTTFTDRSIQSEISKASRQNDPPNVSQAPLAIYNEINGGLDDSLFDSRATVSERESELQRWKENRVPREKWSERTHGPSLPIVKTNAFSIHVDEQCVAENARKEEKLLQKDQEHRLNRRGIASAEGERDRKRPKPAWKKNLLKDSIGNEQCFEEARVEGRCYCLVSPATNFNLIARKSSEEKAEDSSMSMCSSNDESAIYDETIVLDKGLVNVVQTNANLSDNSDPYSPKKIPETNPVNTSWSSIISARLPPPPPPPTINLSSHVPMALGNMNHNRPGPIALDTSWSSNNGHLPRTTVNMNDNRPEIPANASWSSNASGRLPTPTVNMQFAMDQVSMMFSSPMVGEEIGLNAPAPSLSIRNDSPALERENIFRRRYPDARSLPLAESNVLVNLEQEDDGHRSALGCTNTTARRRIGAIRQDDPMAGLQEHDLPSNPGFSVYEDNSNGFPDTTIGASNHLVPNPDDGTNPSKPLSVGTTGFSVFQDIESSSLEVCTTAGISVHRSERAFTVHQNPSLTIYHDIAQQNVTDSNDSVKSDDLMLFGGAAEPGEPTMTNNAFDRLNIGTRRIGVQTTTVRVPLPQFGDISTIEDEDQTAEFQTTHNRLR